MCRYSIAHRLRSRVRHWNNKLNKTDRMYNVLYRRLNMEVFSSLLKDFLVEEHFSFLSVIHDSGQKYLSDTCSMQTSKYDATHDYR